MESSAFPPAQLCAIEARLLGCLIEKEVTTPDYYPLTLNALITACNQTTNRDPVMNLEESTVLQAVDALKAKGWLLEISQAGARVRKYKHHLEGKLPPLSPASTALLCVLLLRGPQTAGELRQRTERLSSFQDLTAVEAALNRFIEEEPSLLTCLPAGPGRRVAQYAQLLTGEPPLTTATPPAETLIPPLPAPPSDDWKQHMETEIQQLKAKVLKLYQQLGLEEEG
jgi:uncharacterized protein